MQKLTEFYTMFTGIIEAIGEIKEITRIGANTSFWVSSPLSSNFKVDQSVAHDGVCLTVEEVAGELHKVTAIAETLQKTNLGAWTVGKLINLERSLLPNSRLDGHFVQGHVDTTGTCEKIKDKNGSFEIKFSFNKKHAALLIEKGSIAINGTSLTIYDVTKNSFKVSIIPYTFEHTNFKTLKDGDAVNLEFDMLGKYIVRKLSLTETN